jgi:hypothetical protein
MDAAAEVSIQSIEFTAQSPPLSFKTAEQFDRRPLRDNPAALAQAPVDFASHRGQLLGDGGDTLVR